MKLIHVALCACALSACTIDEVDDEQPTVEVARRGFSGKMTLLDGDCTRLLLSTQWRQPLPGQTLVSYAITDQNAENRSAFTYAIDSEQTSHMVELDDLLQSTTDGRHRFILETALIGSNFQPLVDDTYRARLLCVL